MICAICHNLTSPSGEKEMIPVKERMLYGVLLQALAHRSCAEREKREAKARAELPSVILNPKPRPSIAELRESVALPMMELPAKAREPKRAKLRRA